MKVPATSSRTRSVSSAATAGVLLLAGLGLLSADARAGTVEKAEVVHDNGRYRLDLSMRIDSDPAAVYAIVTDYDRLTRISRTIIDSSELEHDAGIRRRLVTETCVWFFCFEATMVEDIIENDASVHARIVPALSDYRYGESVWRVRAVNGGTRVTFQCTIEPDFWVPPVIGTWMMKNRMREEAEHTVLNIEQLTHEQRQE